MNPTTASGNISSDFSRMDAERADAMRRVEECARLSDPRLVKMRGKPKDSTQSDNYQNVGSRMVENLSGQLLMASYPPGMPWQVYSVSDAVRHLKIVSEERIDDFDRQLFAYSLVILAALEEGVDQYDRRQIGYNRSLFRESMLRVNEQSVGTGDHLFRLHDDMRIQHFDRWSYVTERDSCCDPVLHITKESIDALELTDDKLEIAKLRVDELKTKSRKERQIDMFTRVEWQPRAKKWDWAQEVNGVEIEKGSEDVTPWICASLWLAPGDNYGRGLIEKNLGDVRRYEAFTKNTHDIATAMGFTLFLADYAARINDHDFTRRPNLSMMRCRVASGQAVDLTMFSTQKQADMAAVQAAQELVRRDLASAGSLDAELAPHKERVTATQINQITSQSRSSQIGPYTCITGHVQPAMFARAEHVMTRGEKPRLAPMSEDLRQLAQPFLLGGLSAVSYRARLGSIAEFYQTLQAFDPNASSFIKTGRLAHRIAKFTGMYDVDIIKSDAERAQEANAQVQMVAAQAMAEAAAKEGAKAVGTIATQGAVA